MRIIERRKKNQGAHIIIIINNKFCGIRRPFYIISIPCNLLENIQTTLLDVVNGINSDPLKFIAVDLADFFLSFYGFFVVGKKKQILDYFFERRMQGVADWDQTIIACKMKQHSIN